MKKINILLLVFFCLSINNPVLLASNNSSKLDSMIYRIQLLDSKVEKNETNIGDLNNKTSDAELFRKLESIEKEIYDRDHKLTMNYANILLVVASIVFGLAISIFGVSFYFSQKKWKDEFSKKIKDFSDEANKKIDIVITELNNNVNETISSFYYQFGIKFFNEKRYYVSIDFFVPLHKSGYRCSEVCFYLAQSYFNIKDFNNVLNYINKSLDSTQDNIEAYGIFSFLNRILYENKLNTDFKNDICSFLKDMNNEPKDYFQKNTNDLIKKIANDFCAKKENTEE